MLSRLKGAEVTEGGPKGPKPFGVDQLTKAPPGPEGAVRRRRQARGDYFFLLGGSSLVGQSASLSRWRSRVQVPPFSWRADFGCAPLGAGPFGALRGPIYRATPFGASRLFGDRFRDAVGAFQAPLFRQWAKSQSVGPFAIGPGGAFIVFTRR